MNTSFKPKLPQYGKRKVYNYKKRQIQKALAVIAALPLGTSWMFLLIPFVRDFRYVRFM